MLTALFSIPFILIFIWLLWLLYLWISPKINDENTPEIIRSPKFWQFAGLMFVIGFALIRNEK